MDDFVDGAIRVLASEVDAGVYVLKILFQLCLHQFGILEYFELLERPLVGVVEAVRHPQGLDLLDDADVLQEFLEDLELGIKVLVAGKQTESLLSQEELRVRVANLAIADLHDSLQLDAKAIQVTWDDLVQRNLIGRLEPSIQSEDERA